MGFTQLKGRIAMRIADWSLIVSEDRKNYALGWAYWVSYELLGLERFEFFGKLLPLFR